MTVHVAELQARAKRKYARVLQRRRDPRYKRVLGRLASAGLLITNEKVRPYTKPVRLTDALFAGEIEPRVFELLPALVIKKPSLFLEVRKLPPDLAAAVRALRRNETPEAFRGIPGADLMKWLPRVGHRHKLPSRLKSFRFSPADAELLKRVSLALGLSETETLRRGLRLLAERVRSPDVERG